MKSIGCDVAAVASVAGDQKPMATGVIIFNELLAIYRDPEIPMRRRIEEAELMLAYESPAVRNGQVRIEWKIWMLNWVNLAGLMRRAIKVLF